MQGTKSSSPGFLNQNSMKGLKSNALKLPFQELRSLLCKNVTIHERMEKIITQIIFYVICSDEKRLRKACGKF